MGQKSEVTQMRSKLDCLISKLAGKNSDVNGNERRGKEEIKKNKKTKHPVLSMRTLSSHAELSPHKTVIKCFPAPALTNSVTLDRSYNFSEL